MKLSRQLVEFILSREWSESAAEAAEKLLLDALGCAQAGQNAAGIEALRTRFSGWGGLPEAGLLFSEERMPAPWAALINGTAIHAWDYDDIHMPSLHHLSSVIIPAALAVAEMEHCSGEQLISGIIAGVETAGRLGNCIRQQGAYDALPGWLPTTVIGGFGGVVAGSVILGLSVDETVSALGINYAQSSGNRQALMDMKLTKRLQPGFAAQAAVMSVLMARDGITGAEGALDGQHGLFPLYFQLEKPDEALLFKENPCYEIERVSIKQYTSCGGCHLLEMAAERMREKYHLVPDEIERVEIYGLGLSPGNMVGNRFVMGETPQVNAQFSVYYCVAYGLLRGPFRLQAFTDDAIRADREVADFAQKIFYTENLPIAQPALPEPPADYPHPDLFHSLIVYTKDQRVLVESIASVECFVGECNELPAVKKKFADCVEFAGMSGAADRLIDQILQVRRSSDCEDFVMALRPA